MESKKLQELLAKFREGKCTDEEKALIEYWMHHLNQDGDAGLTEDDFAEAEHHMWQQVNPQKPAVIRQMPWVRIAAALLLFVSAALVLNKFLTKKDTNTVATATQYQNKIKPGGNKAILTLADGKKIILSDASNGQIAEQAGIKVTKQADGQLIYTVANTGTSTGEQMAYNTIETPRGGQYQINLPDGSKVWLNAASSLRFPVKFDKDSRSVELTGEGYFEIKHIEPVKGQALPFLVKTNAPASGRSGQTVEVLGTHFNINAYADESIIKTTLLEGSVRVTPSASYMPGNSTTTSKMLKPGQQSVLALNDIAVGDADTEAAVAWKNGYFRFNDENLESIMRKVSKWYDVDVVYQNENLKKETFSGVTTRFSNVSELLKMLELTGVVKFDVTGNKILVTDKKTN